MMHPDEMLVIYHGNCADGFGAAWAVRHSLGELAKDVIFHPGVYQEQPPCVEGKFVVLVDFSYPPEVLLKMLDTAYGVLVIDHHKSAMERCAGFDWPSGRCVDMSAWTGGVDVDRYVTNLVQDHCENVGALVYTYFDMSRSGAMMAWEFFNPEKEAPQLIEHIQDRDLWRFELPNTREIQAAIFSYEYDFGIWDAMMNYPVSQLIEEGKAIERKHFKDIREFISRAGSRMVIAGHEVPALNAPYFYSSDAGHILAQGEKFAACYWDEEDKRVFSLRSANDGMDVSKIAQAFGGGGHKNAAGFSVPHGQSVA